MDTTTTTTTLTSQTAAVRSAVSSVATCTPATSALLKSLLLPKDDNPAPPADEPPPPPPSSRTASRTATTTTARSRANTTTGSRAPSRRGGAKAATPVPPSQPDNPGLSTRDKATLATQVINSALKALSEAAKPPPAPALASQPPDEPSSGGELVKTATRNNTLRRTSSAPPISPLQPRPLNRQSTSPSVPRSHARSPSKQVASLASSPNLLSLVECARVALATLRQIVTSGKVTLPEWQLESGMSALVSRLISLGLHEQAIRELRTLKKRLETLSGSNDKKAGNNGTIEPKTSAEAFAEIFDFSNVKFSGQELALVITTQIQGLRVLGLTKKPSAIEAVVPHLGLDKTYSPFRFLMQAAKEKGADKGKMARQMETVSQCLLVLTPGVGSKDDALAQEQRLSVAPGTALELQTLALEGRLQWWEMVEHRGDVEKEVMVPLGRFLGGFIRRTDKDAKTSYKVVEGVWGRIEGRMGGMGVKAREGSKMPVAVVYQTLATLAKEAGLVREAVGWGQRLRDMVVLGGGESIAKNVGVAAQLLGFQLKDRTKYLHDDGLVGEVVGGIQGPLRGDMTELDELLGNVVQVRKAAVSVLVVERKSAAEGSVSSLQASTKELLETLVLQTPRFCLRWLGKPPGPKGSTKDYLRYEQRRLLLLQSLQQNLESAFLVIKVRLEEGRMAWELTDSVLTDCVTLLEYTGNNTAETNTASSMYVKISHFYYLQYNSLRQTVTDPKDPTPLRALRRSVDCVKYRSSAEKEKAQLILKLERQSDLAKKLGRGEEAMGALFAIRTSLLEDGVLANIAKGLATQSPVAVWERDEKAEALSRALVAISQMEQVWMDWTVDLSEGEQAAALEHRLRYILLRAGGRYTDVTLEHPCVDQLLRIYIPTRYPIRRLRVLLSLLCAALGKLDKAEELLAVAKDASQVEDLGEDGGLVGYLQHMKALYGSLAAAVDGYRNAGALQESLSVWQGIIKSCQDKAQLDKSVDDVPGLLDYLQSIADFLRMKGRDEMLASVLELITAISQVAAARGSKAEELLQHNSALAVQYTNLGQSQKAEQLFTKARAYLGDQASGDAIASFYLACAEHAVALGNFKQAEEDLSSARAAYTSSSSSNGGYTRLQKKQLVAYAYYLHSILAQEKGDSHHALVYSRESVRAIMAEWVKLEAQLVASSIASQATPDASTADITTLVTTAEKPPAGPAFWKMFYHLFRNVLRLSSVYAHLGLFQETMYYAEQAAKIAGAVNSEFYNSSVQGWIGELSWKSGGFEKAQEMLGLATGLFTEAVGGGEGGWFGAAGLAVRLSEICVGVGNVKGAEWLLGRAEGIVKGLMRGDEVKDVEEKMGKLKIEDVKVVRGGGRRGGGVPASGVRKPVRKTGAAGARATAAKVKTTAAAAKAGQTTPEPVVVIVEDAQLARLRASILVQKAVLMLKQKEWAGAQTILSEAAAATTVKSSDLLPTRQLAMASCLLGMSMEQMAQDPVFSVIQDSTISFPALLGMEKSAAGLQSSPVKGGASPKKGVRTAGKGEGAKELPQGVYVDNLREAHDYLLEAHSVAAKSGDSALIHKISGMLQHVGLFLTATSSSRAKATVHSAQTSYSVELARNLIWRRERKAVIQEKHAPRHDGTEWPPALQSVTSRRSSLGFTLDLHKVQRDYIDIVPKSWNVISIALSEGNQDLCITKLQAGQNPFVIRLPLERATSRDADSDVFNFQQGRSELLDIIRQINETCHSAKDMNVKGAKTEWWNAREALDERLKELLENIEQIWLGGFRGIFSQHCRRADLLARFQKSFLAMMDKHLPSRRQVRGKKTKAATTPKVQLDLNILELFIGLGDATKPGTDFDDELTDLLYFVVDILQFHGERNAYDEIDFDSMVVETFDALTAYHSAVNGTEEEVDTGIHTILLLDKALHVFPWESLPCMQGLAISRMPSLACLRRLILEQRQSSPPPFSSQEPDIEGHHINFSSSSSTSTPAKGAYILNPSSDLASTQATFGPPLSAHLSSFASIISRPPTEPEFEGFLSDKDLLLYFGHGSGAQYIRGRTIRRLDRCKATVLLMGCSSAALTEAGEFEPSGPAWNYMLAGSPAVVGTLWDVTDRDIDRFAGRMLEGEKKMSLVEAVAEAREGGCRFRFVTAAAVVVYGVPVYVWR
ncbi:peptidase family C50-domain-containing protein [Apiosordaria backusii]|uniref:separase n=1 Tax=Apiosordaria backusii TaxID=314023 RepID=A0AA40F059_9PEZI|nr:peptidase family C50-domain-containing protein [Apiosordaria backusii]